MRFVDCSKRGGYNPADKCKQTCLNEYEDKPEPVMCIKRYVDCSRRGGYNPKDKCRQTCMKEKEDLNDVSHKYLEGPETIKLPEKEVKKMEGEVAAFFKMGSAGVKAFGSFIKKQYRTYQEWNQKYKEEPDNLKLQYNKNYYKTRYGQYKKHFAIAEKKDKEENAKRYEVEERKKEAEELKKAELEQSAFEKQENVLMEKLEKAKESKNRDEAIKTMLKEQHTNYQKAIEWAKTAAVDTTLNDRAKAMAKRSAQWE